jgi:Ca2+:H+ antiporter
VAGWIGRATEALAARVGEGLGGLLNATFGNAAELIIAGIALSKGLITVVKASITGSIIGNVLLVFGLSILLGGVKFKEQYFNAAGARASVISLSLAAIGLIIPTVFHGAAHSSPGGWSALVEQKLSLGIAIVLFLTYLCVLGFSLRTHKYFFQCGEQNVVEESNRQWSTGKAVAILLVATAFVALLSEFLVGTVEQVRHSLGITEVFVGVIIVAIVGNAAEHSTAILMAMKNKMNLSVGIAIGSSLQIALFVAPVLIFLSYVFGRPMSLEFSLPEVFAVVASVYILFQISGDGETNWIEGVQLLSVYVILGILFFYLPEPNHAGP